MPTPCALPWERNATAFYTCSLSASAITCLQVTASCCIRVRTHRGFIHIPIRACNGWPSAMCRRKERDGGVAPCEEQQVPFDELRAGPRLASPKRDRSLGMDNPIINRNRLGKPWNRPRARDRKSVVQGKSVDLGG